MTLTEMYGYIYTWINTELNTNLSLSIPIIYSNQNAPRPDVPYFLIHRPPVSTIDQGTGNTEGWNFTDEEEDEGEVHLVKQYESAIRLEEIGGDGNTLLYLNDSLMRQDIKSLFRASKLSILRNENINPSTDITENYIEKRAMMDIFVFWQTENDYDPSYIGTVEFEGTYEH